MTPRQRRILLLSVLGIVFLAASLVSFRQTVSGPARIEAAVIWYLSRPAADEIVTGWRRNLLNEKGSQLMMQFERPDVVEIQLADGVTEGAIVSKGDTVAWILSREGGGRVSVLEAELEQAERMLDALEAGSREQDIELARRELDRAQVALDTARVTLKRAIDLHDSGFVSLAELQQAEGIVRVLEAEVAVADANLRAFRAGSRQQDISVGEAEVRLLERELDMARSLPGFRDPVTTPISGRVALADSLGSVLSIERMDTVAVVAWLPKEALPEIKKDQRMSVRFATDSKARHAEIYSTDYSSQSWTGAYAVGLLANSDNRYEPGMTGRASCPIGKQTFLSGARLKLGGMGF